MDNRYWSGKKRSEDTKRKVRENHARFWKGKKHSEETKRKMRESHQGEKCYWYGKSLSDETKKKISLSHRGMKRSTEVKKKISQSLRGKKKLWNRSEDYREKRRIQRLNEIEKKFGGVNFNIKACQFVDGINHCFGYNLQHACNGGEKRIAGYSVDGYDKRENIVFEYDEPHHYYVADGTLKPKDAVRQERIIRKIRPLLFVRYDERTGRLYDAMSNSDLPTLLL